MLQGQRFQNRDFTRGFISIEAIKKEINIQILFRNRREGEG